MTDYIYTRELIDGLWNIDNKDRVDGEGKQIYLAKEVETALPGKIFTMRCAGAECKFVFDGSLSEGEQTTLGNTVQAHKDNT